MWKSCSICLNMIINNNYGFILKLSPFYVSWLLWLCHYLENLFALKVLIIPMHFGPFTSVVTKRILPSFHLWVFSPVLWSTKYFKVFTDDVLLYQAVLTVLFASLTTRFLVLFPFCRWLNLSWRPQCILYTRAAYITVSVFWKYSSVFQ